MMIWIFSNISICLYLPCIYVYVGRSGGECVYYMLVILNLSYSKKSEKFNKCYINLQDEVNKLINMMLGEREREIIRLYYGLDNECLTWEDISKRWVQTSAWDNGHVFYSTRKNEVGFFFCLSFRSTYGLRCPKIRIFR